MNLYAAIARDRGLAARELTGEVRAALSARALHVMDPTFELTSESERGIEPIEVVPYEAAGKVVEGLKSQAWDVCFLAIDPLRAADISFTAPYAVIEGVYLVAETSPVRSNAEVDRPGTRVGVIVGSAYELHLSRELTQATIVRAASSDAVMDLWVAGKLDVVAGVKPQLEADARRIPGLRMLPGRFMAINQAMGTPRGPEAAARYLRDFVEEMKTSGFVARAFASNRITGASMAP